MGGWLLKREDNTLLSRTHSQFKIDWVIYRIFYTSMVVGGYNLPMAKVALQTLIVGIGSVVPTCSSLSPSRYYRRTGT